MPQIEIPIPIFEAARQRAVDEGFSSVDDYIADVVTHELTDDSENFDYLFTPERVADLQRISEEIAAGGKTYTIEEVEAHIAKTREEWIAKHQG